MTRVVGPGIFHSLILFVLRLLAALTVVVVTGVVLDRVGPYQGWVDEFLLSSSPQEADASPDAPDPVTSMPTPIRKRIEEPPPTAAAKNPSSVAAAKEILAQDKPEKTERERVYEALKRIHLEKLPKPRIGSTYGFRLDDGDIIRGELLTRSPGRITIGLENGRIDLPAYALAAHHRARYFPELAAKQLALRDMRVTMAEIENLRSDQPAITARVDDHADDPAGGAAIGPETSSSAEVASDYEPVVDAGDLEDDEEGLRLAVTPAKSDSSVKVLLQEFARWMQYQNRRAGHQIASAAYAKQQGRACVLYLVLNDSFKAQPYDVRFHLAESLWQFWAFRSERFGSVRKPSDAYVILLDDRRNVLGGSRRRNGSQIYVMN